MKTMWIILVACLWYNTIVTSSLNAPIIYPTVKYTTHLPSVGGYQSFMNSLRNNLQTRSESHGIRVLLKPTEITNNNKYLQVELINYESKLSITLAVTVVNVYVIGYKSGTNSFFLKDAPSDAKTLLFEGTTKKTLSLDTNYNSLGDRKKVGLGNGPLQRAIDTLSKFDGKSVTSAFKESLLVVIQMVAEAARFKFIEVQIENHILDEFKPKDDTISLENSWEKLSEQIQLSGSSGVFKTPVQLLTANGANRVVTTVSQIKPDISLLLYKGSGKAIVEEIYSAENVVKERLPVL